jgi:hypothetical protein
VQAWVDRRTAPLDYRTYALTLRALAGWGKWEIKALHDCGDQGGWLSSVFLNRLNRPSLTGGVTHELTVGTLRVEPAQSWLIIRVLHPIGMTKSIEEWQGGDALATYPPHIYGFARIATPIRDPDDDEFVGWRRDSTPHIEYNGRYGYADVMSEDFLIDLKALRETVEQDAPGAGQDNPDAALVRIDVWGYYHATYGLPESDLSIASAYVGDGRIRMEVTHWQGGLATEPDFSNDDAHVFRIEGGELKAQIGRDAVVEVFPSEALPGFSPGHAAERGAPIGVVVFDLALSEIVRVD